MTHDDATRYAAAKTVLLSRSEVSKALSVSERTVDRLAAAGQLPRIRVGIGCVRYRLIDLERLVNGGVESADRPGGPSHA
jgi:excisionase family DNA binding protein